nr:MAG TPA: hypothetical protein [Caudoviricetes sp.]
MNDKNTAKIQTKISYFDNYYFYGDFLAMR